MLFNSIERTGGKNIKGVNSCELEFAELPGMPSGGYSVKSVERRIDKRLELGPVQAVGSYVVCDDVEQFLQQSRKKFTQKTIRLPHKMRRISRDRNKYPIAVSSRRTHMDRFLSEAKSNITYYRKLTELSFDDTRMALQKGLLKEKHLQRTVERFVYENGPSTIEMISIFTGVPQDLVNKYVTSLQQSGRIVSYSQKGFQWFRGGKWLRRLLYTK